MGIVDMFSSEDRVPVRFSDFYGLMKEATKAEFLMNGVKSGIDHDSMYAMVTGEHLTETIPMCEGSCPIPGISEIDKEDK